MKKTSLKLKLTILMAVATLLVILSLCLINVLFFEKYYMKDREKKLIKAFNTVKTLVLEEGINGTTLKDKVTEINTLENITIFVIDSNWNALVSTQSDIERNKKWLLDFVFNANDGSQVLSKTNEYTIKKGVENLSGLSYLAIYGLLDDGTQVVMHLNIESIRLNIKIFNRFIEFIGLGVVLVSIIVVYIFASKFTKPIKKLSKVAEEMSELNFDVKYNGKYHDEIGVLGQSMNAMSEKLKENIAQLKQANYELQKDNEIKTEAANRQKEFLANVSHELKTPIALIQGYAEGLKDGVADDKESIAYYCEVITDEAIKMNNLVKQLLTLDNIENGNKDVNIERFDIVGLIKAIIQSNKIRTEQKNIMVKYNGPEECYVWYDQLQIEEVITNFFTNAINHSEGEITVSLEANNSKARINVFNSGKNIPDDSIDRIWEKFYKVDKARTREYGGNGIGLSIVKAILDGYNCEFGAKNEINGVSFFFELDTE